jgi:predicted RNA-binding protein with PUA-like domain
MSVSRYWLLKTEGDVYPVEQLEQDGKTPWSGVRNFRARNYMRDEMRVGDLCLFYHASCKVPGVYGIAKVASRAYSDPTQFDKTSDYFDPKSSEENPMWILVDIAFVKKIVPPITALDLKQEKRLSDMLLWRMPRLSIQPIKPLEFERIIELSKST